MLDGLVTAAGASGSPQDLKVFLGQIQAISILMGCNTLLLNSLWTPTSTSPEQTMVDGIIVLRQQLVRSRHERALEVIKFRGASVLYGAHTFRIGDDGIEIFPQLEALPVAPLAPGISRGRVGSGVPGLDEMLGGGGYPAGSVTAISGPEGAGKTLLGLHFLAAATAAEPGLLFGLDESGEMAEPISAAFGIELEGLKHEGCVALGGATSLRRISGRGRLQAVGRRQGLGGAARVHRRPRVGCGDARL